jgi:hypothetical protein
MSRISRSDGYSHMNCPWFDCARAYCKHCRLLFRICESVRLSWEGDPDLEYGEHEYWELTGTCPECGY